MSNACHNSTQSSASALAGVATWTAAGFPASQIVLGLPSYGYISRSSAGYLQTRARVARSQRKAPRHVPMHVDGPSGDDVDALGVPFLHSEGSASQAPPGVVMVTNEDGGTDDGQVQFRDLVQQGILQYISAWSATAAAPTTTTTTTASYASARVGSDAADGSGDTDSEDSGSDGSDSGSGSGSDSSSDSDSADPTGSQDGSSDQTDTDAATLNTLSFAGHQISNVFTALQGFERRWDACSSTPYLRSAAARQVVTYDDPQSLEMKAVFARYAGLLGVNMFDVHGDTDAWDLADAARRGLGL